MSSSNAPQITIRMTVDQLTVITAATRRDLGQLAARDVADRLAAAIEARGTANLVVATGNSQLDFIVALVEIMPDWSKINVFHQDEYVGISAQHSASFRRWTADYVLDHVTPLGWYPINGDDAQGPAAEAARYAELLAQMRPDVTVIGIGENSHIAFNDPPADTTTTALVHVVRLDEVCRRQQVGEGHFPTVDDVPREAISLTIAGLLWSHHLVAVVPEFRKALAVRCALEAPISPRCPASLLRTTDRVTVYLDAESSSLLDPQFEGSSRAAG